MARNKYIYHHFVNNKEVSKDEFLKALMPYCCVCDTNYDNPLLNIAVLDENLLKRKYDYYKTHPHHTTIYVDDKMSFHINREVKKNV